MADALNVVNKNEKDKSITSNGSNNLALGNNHRSPEAGEIKHNDESVRPGPQATPPSNRDNDQSSLNRNSDSHTSIPSIIETNEESGEGKKSEGVVKQEGDVSNHVGTDIKAENEERGGEGENDRNGVRMGGDGEQSDEGVFSENIEVPSSPKEALLNGEAILIGDQRLSPHNIKNGTLSSVSSAKSGKDSVTSLKSVGGGSYAGSEVTTGSLDSMEPPMTPSYTKKQQEVPHPQSPSPIAHPRPHSWHDHVACLPHPSLPACINHHYPYGCHYHITTCIRFACKWQLKGNGDIRVLLPLSYSEQLIKFTLLT